MIKSGVPDALARWGEEESRNEDKAYQESRNEDKAYQRDMPAEYSE